jgi:hypothetical protein
MNNSGGGAHAGVHGHAGVANGVVHNTTAGSTVASVLGLPASRATSLQHTHLPHSQLLLSLAPKTP